MTTTISRIAAVQMVSTPVPAENFAAARRLVGEAAQQGAQLVLLPEYWPIMGLQESDKIAYAEQPGAGPIQQFMLELAREHRIWLIGGTLPIVAPEADKVLNTMMVYDPNGVRVMRYDKIAARNPTTKRAPSCAATTWRASRPLSAESVCRCVTTCVFRNCIEPWAPAP